jgi:hypothetical protein
MYDAVGREVATLVNEEKKLPDTYNVQWNAASYPNGIYFARLEVSGYYGKAIKLNKIN